MSSFFSPWVNSAFAALKCGEEAIGEKLPLPDFRIVSWPNAFAKKATNVSSLN